jgi:UTP--glucose-1-phosphate uridylyltransferase
MRVRKAVIPAAGLGTRFLPATKAQPKEMLPIITGRNKSSIENHFDKSVELELELEKSGKLDLLEEVRKISDMVNIHYIRQKEPKGLGHAIHCAKSFIGDEPFAVLLGDDIEDRIYKVKGLVEKPSVFH